jgi:hypothetical protein
LPAPPVKEERPSPNQYEQTHNTVEFNGAQAVTIKGKTKYNGNKKGPGPSDYGVLDTSATNSEIMKLAAKRINEAKRRERACPVYILVGDLYSFCDLCWFECSGLDPVKKCLYLCRLLYSIYLMHH